MSPFIIATLLFTIGTLLSVASILFSFSWWFRTAKALIGAGIVSVAAGLSVAVWAIVTVGVT